MGLSKSERIKRYNFEEIMLILFILSSELSTYDEEDIINFVENIEGRIDVLFEPGFILKLSEYLKVEQSTLESFDELRSLVLNLYTSQWHKILKQNNEVVIKIRTLAKRILNDLKIEYVEPMKYLERHLNIDWDS